MCLIYSPGFIEKLGQKKKLSALQKKAGSLELLLTGLTGSKTSEWSALNVTDKRFIQSPSKLFFGCLVLLCFVLNGPPFCTCFLWTF